jgi:hypothetical protein
MKNWQRAPRLSKRGLSSVLLLLLGFVSPAVADELHLNFGGGPQVGSDATGSSGSQINYTAGIDYSFYRYDRSPRSSFIIGASYTYMAANSSEFDQIHALSLYPQLSMYPSPTSWVHKLVPGNGEPFFFVRALGPSYISANRLGERRQAKNFAFQAQIGIGALYKLQNDRQASISISWKHFSNANLFSENDGIDLPIVLNIGILF